MHRFCASAASSPAHSARSASAAPPVWPVLVVTAAVAIDIVAIVLARALVQVVTHDAWRMTVSAGGVAAGLVVVVGLWRQDYRVSTLLADRRTVPRVLGRWLLAGALLLAAAVSFGTAMPPAPWTVWIVVAAGLCGAVGGHLGLVTLARRWARAGRLTVERLMLLGTDTEVPSFLARHDPARHGLRLVAATVLRNEPLVLGEDLGLAIATARMHRPDRLVLLFPWTDQAAIDRCVEALRCLPVAIDLGPTTAIERLAAPLLAPQAPLPTVPLIRTPLSGRDRSLKRAVDVMAAAGLLLTLLPILLVIAVAIKVDSPGPVFFRQRRTGYNLQPFRIIKFRSMTTLEDSATLRQVTENDVRVTRVGRLLRATSLDELPQLINVLAGDMSLIGPRPHAVAHDQAFGRSFASYGRRHTIRPGITGWAQVSGFRGETDTPDKIEGRVRHDLDYIDNWSLWLDASIVLRTIFSRQTFRNAR